MGKKNRKQEKRPAQPAGSFWGRMTARHGRHGALLLLAIASLLVASLAYAMQGERPWSRTVQKRLEKKQPLQPKEYAIIGVWWASVINASLLTALLMTSRRWLPPESKEEANSVLADQQPVPGPEASPNTAPVSTSAPMGNDAPLLRVRPTVILVLTLGAVMFGAWLRYPRLHHSLWNDEEYAMRRFAHGSWEDKGNGISLFSPVTWTDTLYENRNGNNHLLNSLITREALVVWRYYADAPRDAFNEAAMRVPAFVAGLLTIGLISLLGRELAAPLTGITAAWLLAASPWHLRYSVEAKGYSFMLFFICLALLALVRALRKNGVHWWIVFSISEAAFLLSFAGSLYVALAINSAAALILLKNGERSRWWTLGAFNLLAAVPVLWWMLPSIPQLTAYLNNDGTLHLGFGWPWVRDLLSGLMIGFQYSNPDPANHVGTDWLAFFRDRSLSALFLGVIVPLLFALGLVAAWRRSAFTRLAILSPFIACVLAYAHNAYSNSPMVVWYLLYGLIPLVLALPLGIESLQKRPSPWIWLGLAGLATSHAMATWQPCMILREHDRQPIRQTVASIREQAPDALTAVFGVSDRQTMSYDPGVKTMTSVHDLEKLVAKSRLTGFDLYVYFCGAFESGKRNPDLLEALKSGIRLDSGTKAEFERTSGFKGTEEMFSYQVYKLKQQAQ